MIPNGDSRDVIFNLKLTLMIDSYILSAIGLKINEVKACDFLIACGFIKMDSKYEKKKSIIKFFYVLYDQEIYSIG